MVYNETMVNQSFLKLKKKDDLSGAAIADHPEPSYNPPRSYKKKRNPKSILTTLSVILVILLIGGGIYWYSSHHKAPKKTAQNNTTQQITQTPAVSKTTAQYTSNEQNMNLSFSYPTGWQVTPATTTSTGNQPITISSPVTSIDDASGTTGAGKIIINIRPTSDQVTELATGTPTVAQDSVQFSYSAPTTVQLQYPYLTFVHYANSSSVAGSFEEVFITGSTTMSAGTSISSDYLSAIDPIVSASFYKCTTNSCSVPSSPNLGITNNQWLNSQLFVQVMTLFQSLKFN